MKLSRYLSLKAEGKLALTVLALITLCSSTAMAIWTWH
ncbi:hypothetical protein CUJ84_pRLN3000053 (plasmid) [Rhizobium leguminosarum]|uniref:Uncharacterized protein n=1 Tax=Rhizobium leguminosarum TaxID=384 RepID=A0A2K9ZGM3_RHILE|nr:hypothetical protein CUJ84_pRLN3000053 [Rhizobium leguminosarum]